MIELFLALVAVFLLCLIVSFQKSLDDTLIIHIDYRKKILRSYGNAKGITVMPKKEFEVIKKRIMNQYVNYRKRL